MVNFYILHKTNLEILFCNTLNNKDLIFSSNTLKIIFDFYKDTLGANSMDSIKSIIFSNSRIIFRTRYDFIFVLITGVDLGDESSYSQLYFLMNMFLHSFNIKNTKQAKAFITELKTKKKPLHISSSVSGSIQLDSIMNSHMIEIDFRNVLEVFSNIFNSFWIGLLDYMNTLEKSGEFDLWVSEINVHFKESYPLFCSCFELTKNGFLLNDQIKAKGKYFLELKHELITVLDSLFHYFENIFEIDILRKIISNNLVTVIEKEWKRINGLNITKQIIKTCWR